MNQDALNVLLKAVADALAPHIVESVVDKLVLSGMLTTEIDTRIKAALDPMGLESGVIREIVQAELKSKIDNLDIDMYISDWMGCNFDISDYEHNLEIEDKISDWMDSNLTDRVRDEVRELSFSVTVD